MKFKEILKKFACFLIPLLSLGGVIFTTNFSFLSESNYSLLSFANDMVDESHSFTFQFGKEGSTQIDSYKFEQAMNYFNTTYYLSSLSFHIDREDITYRIDGDSADYSVSVTTFPRKDADQVGLLEKEYLKLTNFLRDQEQYNAIPREERIIVDWKTAIKYQSANSLQDYNEMIGKQITLTKNQESKVYTVVGIWDNRREDLKNRFENYFFDQNFGSTFFIEYNEKDMYSFESFIHLFNKIENFKKEYANLRPFIRLSKNSIIMPEMPTNLEKQEDSYSSYEVINDFMADFKTCDHDFVALKTVSVIALVVFFFTSFILDKDVIDSIIKNEKKHSFIMFVVYNIISIVMLVAECFLLFYINIPVGHGVFAYIPLPTILSHCLVIYSFIFIIFNSLYYRGHKKLENSIQKYESNETAKNNSLKINDYLEEKDNDK